MAFTPVQKLSLTSGAAMLLLSAVGVVAYMSTAQLMDAQRLAAATNLNIARLDRVRDRVRVADEAAAAYAQSGDRAAIATLDAAQSDVEYALDSLLIATEDHPVQRRNLDSLGAAVGARFRAIRQVALVREKVGRDSAVRLLAAEGSMRIPGRLIADMRAEEVRILGERSRVMADSTTSTRLFIVVGSVFALVLALVALQPLRPSVGRRLTSQFSAAAIETSTDDGPGT